MQSDGTAAHFDFQLSEDGSEVQVVGVLDDATIDVAAVKAAFYQSPYRHFYLDEQALRNLVDRPGPGGEGSLAPRLVIANKRDGLVEVHIAADEMSAELQITSAYGGINPNADSLRATLKDCDVTFGISEKILDALSSKVVQVAPGTILRVVVARGKEPTESQSGRVEWLATPIQDRELKPQLNEDGSFDMRELGDIQTVEEGQVIVRLTQGAQGENGSTVTGKVLPAKPVKEFNLRPDEGAGYSRTDSNAIVALRRGIPVRLGDSLRVEDVLTVPKVDLATGNLHYDGNIIIRGDITKGMTVEAKGDIFVGGFVESAAVTSGGNITIAQGIVGEQEFDDYNAKVVCEGELSARYAQYGYLKAGKSIRVSTQLLGCCSEAPDVQVGQDGQRKAKLVGGRVISSVRIAAGVIGSPAHVKTILDFSSVYTPIDHERKQILAKIDLYKHERKRIEAERIKIQGAGASPETVAKLKVLMKLENERQHAEEVLWAELATLKGQIDSAIKRIKVEVFGQIYPGVEVVSGAGERDPIETEHKAGTFRFHDGKLLFDS